MILNEVIGGAEEIVSLQVMGDRFKAGISGVIFVKLRNCLDMGRFILKFRGVTFRGHYVSAKYAQREFNEESLLQRDREGMNEGNRLIHGYELRDMMLSEDNYDDPRVRWSQESLNQLGMDPSALYFNIWVKGSCQTG